MADPTQGSPSGGLLGIDPDMLFSLGTGLMSAAKYGGNVGDSLQQAMSGYYQRKQAQQQLGMGKLQLQQLQQEMPLRMGYLKSLGQQLHVANNDPQVTQQLQAGGLMGSQAQQPQQPSSVPNVPGAPSLMGSAPISAGLMAPLGAQSQMPQQQSQMPPQMQRPQMPAGPQPQSGMPDPMRMMQLGAFGGALGMPGSQGLQDLGKTQLQYDPQVATQMEAAKGALAQDQSEMLRAQNEGDTLGFKAAQMKYLKDSGLVTQSSMNGAVQTFGGITPEMLGMSTYNPTQGVRTVGGVETPIPGAPKTEATLAAAKAGAESGAEYAPIYDSTGTQVGFAPRAAIVSQPPRAPGAPTTAGVPNTSGPARGGVSFGLGPQTSEMLKGNAETALETNKEYQTQAEGAQQMLAQVDALKAAASKFGPGQFADKRAQWLNYLNSADLISPAQQQQLGSFQEGQKIAIQLQASATKQLGSREAAQIFQFMGKSLPNLTLSQNGLDKVSSWQSGIARYNIQRAQYANDKAQANDVVGVNQTRDTFIKNSNPLFYVVASAPAPIQRELLNSMGAQRQKFITQWNAAANAGFAPRPGDYQ